MKKIKLPMQALSINDLLSREQMKKVMGGCGSGGGGSAYLCGTRYYDGQCYCDFCDSSTHQPVYCDVPCPVSPVWAALNMLRIKNI